MRLTNIMLLAACHAGLVHLTASELVIKDVYLAAELLPADFDYKNSSDLQSTSGSDEFDSSLGFTLGTLYSWSPPGSSSGWLAGGELTLRQQGIGSEADLTGFGLRAVAGYAYAYNDRFTFTVEPFIGYGIADMTIQNSAYINGFDIDGDYLEYGLRLKSIMALNERWQGFITLGYSFADINMDGGPDGFESELESDGIYASIGFSWRWDTAPWALE